MRSSIIYRRWSLDLLQIGLFFLFIIPTVVNSQPQKTNIDFNIGLKCAANRSGSPSNNFTLGISIGTALHKDDLPASLLLQSVINIYSNGIGTNLLNQYVTKNKNGESVEKRRKVEIDFVNSLIGNLELDDDFDSEIRNMFPIKHFNQMTANANYALKYYTVSYGTNFVFNSHNRNQQVGFIGVNTPWVSLGFYNDGAIGKFIGDNYDRFWTGGGHVRVHAFNPKNHHAKLNNFSVEYNYDRFTYDVQDGYRLANILMIPHVDDSNFYNLLYNNSFSSIKINWNEYSLGYSLLGPAKFDIQNFIHDTMGYPRHLNNSNPQSMISFNFSPIIK